MTWSEFFKWLEASGIHYFRGDVHYAGRGFWFPRSPELDGSEDPKPFGAWIRVSKEQGSDAVFVDTSFGEPVYATSPVVAQAAVERALETYAQIHGVRREAQRPDETEVKAARGRGSKKSNMEVIRAEQARRKAQYEAELDAYSARKQAGTTTEADRQRWQYLPQIRREWDLEGDRLAREQREREKDRPDRSRPAAAIEYKGEALKMRGLRGITDDDSDVSDLCDAGHCARCRGCGHICHTRPERIRGKSLKACSCGRYYTQQEWDELPLLGTQKLEADGDDPPCTMIAKNCPPPCNNTMFVEEEI